MVDPKRPPKTGFHHGNLRLAVLSTARELLRERSIEQFTVAEVCKRENVTTAALYRHFRSKDELLDQIVLQGFAELNEAIRLAFLIEQPQKLSLMCGAYARFSFSEPALFGLMLGPEARRSELVAKARIISLNEFRHQVLACMPEASSSLAAHNLSVRLWTFVHGAARIGQLQYALIAGLAIDVTALVDQSIKPLLGSRTSAERKGK